MDKTFYAIFARTHGKMSGSFCTQYQEKKIFLKIQTNQLAIKVSLKPKKHFIKIMNPKQFKMKLKM